ncbi:MAG: hypothetical protein KF851_17405 [Pirellulaceae bacterium]|nr:hypothetical protein [Pirellulaceae bacterium]
MSLIIERHGAVKFYKPRPQAARPSDTPVFAKSDSDADCVDAEWDTIIDIVNSFASLDDDWDGGGAAAPERGLVLMAVELARQLKNAAYPAPSRAIAGVNGTISFEFADEPFTEIEVVSPDKAEVYETGRLVGTLHADSVS